MAFKTYLIGFKLEQYGGVFGYPDTIRFQPLFGDLYNLGSRIILQNNLPGPYTGVGRVLRKNMLCLKPGGLG